MATVVTKTIKPSGGDYTSLTAWEAAQAGNLVSLDQIREAECYTFTGGLTNSSAFNSGWTTDATRFPRVRAASGNRHTATRASGFYINVVGLTAIRPVSAASYLRVEGVGFKKTGSGLVVSNENGATNIRFDGCYLWNSGGTGDTVRNCHEFWNNFIVGAAKDGGVWTVAATVYNNTVYGCANRGIVTAHPGVVAKNNISVANTGSDFDFQSGTRTNNLSEDATGQIASRTVKQRSDLPLAAGNYVIFEVTAAGSEDLRLVDDAENDALDAGADLTGTFTTDYEGDTRSSTPDLGADEIAAAGGITGNLSQTLVGATLSAAAKLAIEGEAAPTLSSATLSSAAALALQAELAATLAGATLSAAAKLALQAELAATLAGAGLASTAALANSGELAAALAGVTLSATGRDPNADLAVVPDFIIRNRRRRRWS